MTTQMKQSADQGSGASNGLLSELPVDRLKEEAIELGKALAKRGVSKLGASLTGASGKLGDLGDAVPGPGDLAKAATLAPVKGAASKVKDALPGTGSDDSDDSEGSSQGNGKVASMDNTNLKVTNIVETIDVPVSRDMAYQLWTQFEAFPAFMKKVETVKQKKPEVVTWKAQVFWSHRTWTAKIVDQVPPEHIVWKSEGEKGHVDGAVTFHELAPDLTRVLVSLEYFPQGLFERTGNLWRAQGRRVRLELKHYRRFVANHALLQQDEVDGWEGEIHDGEVKRQRRSSSSTSKKSTSSGSTAKKTAARKSTSSGSTAKKTAAKKSTSSGSTAKKTAAKKSTSSGSTARKTAAKKSTSSGSTARKTAAKKSAPQRTAAAAKRSSTTSSRTSSGSRAGKTARSSSTSRSRSKS